jgi:glycosyltransferase involved in cell wall biosynthesis
MLRLVIVGWKVDKYIEKCLKSVMDQDYKDWTACVVLDPSDDNSYDVAYRVSNGDSRIKVLLNSAQKFATANIIRSIKEQPCQDEDIIVTIDGDDWLSGLDSLAIVKGYYDRQPNLLITHGSWVSYPNPAVNTNNAPYSAADWQKGIRKVGWRASHLRTFKYKVWKYVKDEDLKGPDGLYARVAWDLAIMFPMLELSGADRVRYVPELIYTYNQETPYNDGKVRLREQMQFADYFAAKTPYVYREVL